MTLALDDRAARFASRLAATPYDERPDAVANEVIETGGFYCAGISKGLFELSLHGLTTIGDTEASAISAWLRLAQRRAPPEIEEDGFVTVYASGPLTVRTSGIPFPNPRNHCEEIANARANSSGIKD